MKYALRIFVIMLLFTSEAFSQNGSSGVFSAYDEQYAKLMKDWVLELTPPQNPDHKVSRIVIFEPYSEFRYYKSRASQENIYDSSFTSKLAENKESYVIWPRAQEWEKETYSYQTHKSLHKFTDTIVIKPPVEISYLIKKELDSIIDLGKKATIKYYSISDGLLKYLKTFRATQFVFINLLVYKDNTAGGYMWPNKRERITFYVFDTEINKLFFYENWYLTNSTYYHLDTDSLPSYHKRSYYESILRSYKKYLKLYGVLENKSRKPIKPWKK